MNPFRLILQKLSARRSVIAQASASVRLGVLLALTAVLPTAWLSAAPPSPTTAPAGGELLVDPDAPKPPEWRYGKPVAFDADSAIAEGQASAAALSQGNRVDALLHQLAVIHALKAVERFTQAERGRFEYAPGKSYEMAEGRVFHQWKFEAVIGSDVSAQTGLKLGDPFRATHGTPTPNDKSFEHVEQWRVTGVLKPTQTPADQCIFIPLISCYAVADHAEGLAMREKIRAGLDIGQMPQGERVPHYKLVAGNTLDPDLPATQDYISLDLPQSAWALSAILVKCRGPFQAQQLLYSINTDLFPGNLQAVNPASAMREAAQSLDVQAKVDPGFLKPTEYGFDLVVGTGRGCAQEFALYILCHVGKSRGAISYSAYEKLNGVQVSAPGSKERNFYTFVKLAVPVAMGDTYKSHPIVATLPKMFCSVESLRGTVAALAEKQQGLLSEIAESKAVDLAPFAARQTELNESLRQVRAELKKQP